MAEKLDLEVEKILETGVEFLKEYGVPSSAAFFYTLKGKFEIDPFDFRDKKMAKKRLKKIAKKHQATMVITMMDAMITKMSGSLLDPPYLLKKVIFAYGETKTESFGIAQEFECNKIGQIEFGNRIFFPVGTGSMTGFMTRAYC